MKITLAPYNPEWKNIYEIYAQKWFYVLKNHQIPANIQHIGSTSIPPISAKNIIDILIGISNFEQQKEALIQYAAQYLPDFLYVSKWNADMPYRRFFSLPAGEGIQGVGVNVHCVQQGSEFWERHLLFRNYLQQNSSKALEYEQIKQNLCLQEWHSIADYAEAKTPFIRKTEAEALLFFSSPK